MRRYQTVSGTHRTQQDTEIDREASTQRGGVVRDLGSIEKNKLDRQEEKARDLSHRYGTQGGGGRIYRDPTGPTALGEAFGLFLDPRCLVCFQLGLQVKVVGTGNTGCSSQPKEKKGARVCLG